MFSLYILTSDTMPESWEYLDDNTEIGYGTITEEVRLDIFNHSFALPFTKKIGVTKWRKTSA